MYYRARYYNPRTARFISEDPIGLAGGVNLYGYVGGSPTNWTDPSGEFWQAAGILVAGWGFWEIFSGVADMHMNAENKKVMDQVRANELSQASRGSVRFNANSAERAQKSGLEAVAGSAVGASQVVPSPVPGARKDWHEIIREMREINRTVTRIPPKRPKAPSQGSVPVKGDMCQ
jgi:uncharacterized protein RhaS with RHS repeats